MGFYLTLYNNLQTLLWLIGIGLVAASLFVPNLLQYVNQYFIIAQSIMLLDIVHVILKIVHGNLFATILQVLSRVFVVWLILPYQETPVIFNYLMFGAWSLAEIIRYQYYQHKDTKGLLLFLRYNAFIVLYPIGVLLGEIPLIYQRWKTTGNHSFLAILSLYVPFFPYLYIHMLKLRKRNLDNKKPEGKRA